MKSITIGANDAGQRLDKFLLKTFRNLPASLMYRQIRQKNIKRNGHRCQIDDRLQEGDILTLYLRDDVLAERTAHPDFLTASRQLDIVYEDEHLLLLNKKAGVLVHPDGEEYRDTLIARVQRYLYEKGEYRPREENSFAPALVNRIDRNTCGIVCAPLTGDEARRLRLDPMVSSNDAPLGTAFTMEQDFYRGRLQERFGLEVLVPDAEDRRSVHDIIYQELIAGVVSEQSRQIYAAVIARLVARGAEAIILGCTEIMLLVRPEDSAVPLFDTTTLHARAAVDAALA